MISIMKPFLFLFLTGIVLSCGYGQNTDTSQHNKDALTKDSLLDYSRLHYVKLPSTDSSVYLFDISKNYIGIRRRNQITLNESIQKLEEMLPKYFNGYHDTLAFNLALSDGIMSQYALKFNRNELINFFSKDDKHPLSPNSTLNQILLFSNFKDEMNAIFKPYGYAVQKFSSEKVGFDFKGLKKTMNNSNQDSVPLSNEFFVGLLHIKMNKI
jgi:hypothetical protein